MLPDSVRCSSTFFCIAAVLSAGSDDLRSMSGQFLPAPHNYPAVFGIHLDHDASALRVLARNQRRAAPAEGIVYDAAHRRAIENELSQQPYRLHRRMERTASR